MTEAALQIAILQRPDLPLQATEVWAVPNGGSRHVVEAARLKAQGVRAGVADLCVMLPGGKVGFMEVKTPKGRISDKQREFADVCRAYDIPHSYVRSIDDAITAVRAWSTP